MLELPAEIDFCNAMELLPLVLEAACSDDGPAPLLVLDLTGTVFMDSQGARLLDELRHRLPAGVRLRVVATPEGVPSRVLELSGLRRDIPVHDSLAEALGSGDGVAA